MDNSPNIHNNLTLNPEMNFLNFMNEDFNLDEDLVVDSPYLSTEFNCSYISENNFLTNQSIFNKFNILSLNIQSLLSKFEQLKMLIFKLSSANREPAIICLQEIWRLNPDCNFDLPGYQSLIFKSRSGGVQGGGSVFLLK